MTEDKLNKANEIRKAMYQAEGNRRAPQNITIKMCDYD